jgi:hypothetical protein
VRPIGWTITCGEVAALPLPATLATSSFTGAPSSCACSVHAWRLAQSKNTHSAIADPLSRQASRSMSFAAFDRFCSRPIMQNSVDTSIRGTGTIRAGRTPEASSGTDLRPCWDGRSGMTRPRSVRWNGPGIAGGVDGIAQVRFTDVTASCFERLTAMQSNGIATRVPAPETQTRCPCWRDSRIAMHALLSEVHFRGAIREPTAGTESPVQALHTLQCGRRSG